MTKKGTTGKPKIRRREKEKYCTFVIEITDWEMTYLFSLNRDKDDSSPYSEYPHLEIKGVIRQPEKHAGKNMSATFMGSREMIGDLEGRSPSETKPKAIGSVTLRGEYRQYLGSLPFDSLPPLTAMLESKRLQCFHLYGLSPRYGHSMIESVHFFKEYDPAEFSSQCGIRDEAENQP